LKKKAELNKKDQTGTTALFNAIYLGRTIMIKDLLEKTNLDLTIKDGKNRNALEAAEFYENYEIYKILKDAFQERGINI